MQNNKLFLKNIIIGAVILVVALASGTAISQKIKFGSANPAAAQTPAPASYEEQGIQAVRAVKPSIVDIVGNGDIQDGNISSVKGTGFIFDSNGLIVSNSHVVQDPKVKYTVVFADGTQYDATVLGLDKLDDVALLKIDASDLPAAKLGDSNNLETGQTVFAIGNSLGKYQNTVTKGVVSGLGRAVDISDILGAQPRLQNLIQTDAAINPGNSGGPLINLRGEIIGMNTLIDAGGAGLGFSIPINGVKSVVEQLQKFGKVSKPFMGVSFLTVDKAVQVFKKLKVGDGAYVDKVTAGGSADKAGIKPGDVITRINREKLTVTNELDSVVGRFEAGNQVLITLDRNGEQVDLPLILGQYNQ